jgi:hypothetical protein
MLSFVMRVTDTELGGLLGIYLRSIKEGTDEWKTAKEQLGLHPVWMTRG